MAVQRKYANKQDTESLCPICHKAFIQRQRILFNWKSQPIHVYRCRRQYYAALAVYYKLDAEKLVKTLTISPRTAYRIVAEARSMVLEQSA